MCAEQLVFVELAGAQSGHENLPEAAAEDLAHRHAPAVPAVELADHADPPSIGRPDREGDALHPFVPDCMCAELLIAGEVIALDQQMNVEFAEHRTEAVSILEFMPIAGPQDPQPIPERLLPLRHAGDEHARGMNALAMRDDGA